MQKKYFASELSEQRAEGNLEFACSVLFIDLDLNYSRIRLIQLDY
jgi:hypothetical protein